MLNISSWNQADEVIMGACRKTSFDSESCVSPLCLQACREHVLRQISVLVLFTHCSGYQSFPNVDKTGGSRMGLISDHTVHFHKSEFDALQQ